MPNALNTLTAVGASLDGLSVGFYALDLADRTICWNRTFMQFFPEHASRMEVGEPYANNLRRFYASRLERAEFPLLETYVSKGLVRNREQRAPYTFEHRGRTLKVSSIEIPNVGRVRIWLDVTAQASSDHSAGSGRDPLPSRFRGPLSPEGLEMLESLADGVSVIDQLGRVAWTNAPFRVMYDLPENARVIGANFADVYRSAWNSARDSEADSAAYERGAVTLLENLRFAGAPFELPLPKERWVRVLHHIGSNGMTYLAHVDITRMKHEQGLLIAAEQQAKQSEQRYRLLAEYSSDLIVSVVGQTIDYVSPAARELLGMQPEELVGLTKQTHVESPNVSDLRDFILSRKPGVTEMQLPKSDGSMVWIEALSRTIPPSGLGGATEPAFARYVLNLRNVSRRKAVEQQLEEANERITGFGVSDV